MPSPHQGHAELDGGMWHTCGCIFKPTPQTLCSFLCHHGKNQRKLGKKNNCGPPHLQFILGYNFYKSGVPGLSVLIQVYAIIKAQKTPAIVIFRKKTGFVSQSTNRVGKQQKTL